MFFNGLPEMPIENISVKDVVISDAQQGIVIRQAKNVVLENVDIQTPGQKITVKQVENVTINGEIFK